MVHSGAQAAAGKLLAAYAPHREQGDVDAVAAAGDGTGLQLIEHPEEIVLAEHSALGW